MFGGLIRAAERWRGPRFTEFRTLATLLVRAALQQFASLYLAL
jgi:hypothetical protein